MIFAEGTDMNLNYLQPKGICIFPKIKDYRTKVSFLSNNLIYIGMLGSITNVSPWQKNLSSFLENKNCLKTNVIIF